MKSPFGRSSDEKGRGGIGGQRLVVRGGLVPCEKGRTGMRK